MNETNPCIEATADAYTAWQATQEEWAEALEEAKTDIHDFISMERAAGFAQEHMNKQLRELGHNIETDEMYDRAYALVLMELEKFIPSIALAKPDDIE